MTECCMNCIYYRPLRYVTCHPYHESEESCCVAFANDFDDGIFCGRVHTINRWDMCEMFTPKGDKTNEI